MKKKMLLFAAGLLLLFVLVVSGVLVSSGLVHRAATGKIIADAERLPSNDVGLVLGTSKFTGPDRLPNAHFENRVAAAADLYRLGKVKHLLLSGDNGTRGYDEPADMKEMLLSLGVPLEAITLDDAGFRTLDSIVRARKVFGQERLTIITDRFHTYRALFLARHEGIDAVAYPSREVQVRYSVKTRVREYLADVRACLDLYVLHTKPRFLGPAIEVRVAHR